MEVLPDPYSVLGYQSDLVRLYMLLGEEMAQKFGAKESAYLARKIEQAKAYQAGRIELKMGDATEAALLAVKQKHQDQIDAEVEYELYRALLRSLQNAIDHSRQIVSFLKTSESSSTSS